MRAQYELGSNACICFVNNNFVSSRPLFKFRLTLIKYSAYFCAKRQFQCFQIRRICAKMAHLDPLVAHIFCQFAHGAKSEKYGAFRIFPENYCKKGGKCKFQRKKEFFLIFLLKIFCQLKFATLGGWLLAGFGWFRIFFLRVCRCAV